MAKSRGGQARPECLFPTLSPSKGVAVAAKPMPCRSRSEPQLGRSDCATSEISAFTTFLSVSPPSVAIDGASGVSGRQLSDLSVGPVETRRSSVVSALPPDRRQQGLSMMPYGASCVSSAVSAWRPLEAKGEYNTGVSLVDRRLLSQDVHFVNGCQPNVCVYKPAEFPDSFRKGNAAEANEYRLAAATEALRSYLREVPKHVKARAGIAESEVSSAAPAASQRATSDVAISRLADSSTPEEKGRRRRTSQRTHPSEPSSSALSVDSASRRRRQRG